MPKSFDDATSIQNQLVESSAKLSKATEMLEQIRLQKRVAMQEIDLLKADSFAEQTAMGEDGLFKGKTNKEGREAMFESFFRKQNPKLFESLRELETKEVNAKISEQTEGNRFDALKKVADLQIRKLEYETQTVVLQSILKRTQEAQIKN